MSADRDEVREPIPATTGSSSVLRLRVDSRKPKVVLHPAGGWTLAYPDITGTHRIYRGHFATRHAAELANFS